MKPEGRIEEMLNMYQDGENIDLNEPYHRGYVSALKWVLEDDEYEEKFGKYWKSCPVDEDCDYGPTYGQIMWIHIEEEHGGLLDKLRSSE